MKTFVKIFFALIVMFIVAIIAAPYVISDAMVKEQLVAKIKETTGQELSIGGEFTLRFFPFVGVSMSDVKLSENHEGAYAPALAFKALDVDIALLPLLSKNVVLKGAKITDGAVHFNDPKTKKKWDAKSINLSASLSGMSSPLQANGSMTWNGMPIQFKTEISTPDSFLNQQKTAVTANIKLDAFDIQLKTSALCTQTQCDFSDLALGVNQLQATGEASAAFGAAKPVINATLSTSELNIDQFLPKEKQAAFPIISSAYANASDWSRDPIDLSALRSFDGNFKVTAAKIIIQNMQIGKTILAAKITDGVAAIDIPSMELYGGKGVATGVVDASGSMLRIQRNTTVSHVNLGALLKDATSNDQLSGTANFTSHISTSGRSVHDMVSALQGNGSIKITDGALKGINIAEKARSVRAAYQNLTKGGLNVANIVGAIGSLQSAFESAGKATETTDFAEMGGTFTINQGIVNNNDLSMKAPLFRLSGNGSIHLPLKTLSYHLLPEIIESAEGQGGKEKKGLAVPILVSGSLENPSYSLDEAALTQTLQKNASDALGSSLQKLLAPKTAPTGQPGAQPQTKPDLKKEGLNAIKGLLNR